jgi:hypothetical protein
MLARKDGQLKTQNQALEETVALQFAEQQDIAQLQVVGNSQARSDIHKQIKSLKRAVEDKADDASAHVVGRKIMT